MCCGQPYQVSSISCAMIVRNAEATLETALNSVARQFDEIVIVDTGSTDQTKQLAKRFTHHVYDFSWCDDFAAARQFAHDKCSSEWVFFLDADDEVMGAEHLRTIVDNAPDHMDAYMIRYVLDRDSRGKAITEFYRERLVRKDRMRWVGRVHEVMVPVDGKCAYERFDPTWVLHHGHGDGQDSLLRNIRLLQLDLAEHPDELRTLFYLGRDLVQAGRMEEGIDLLERYQEAATWADERFIALSTRGYALRILGRYLDAYRNDVRLLTCQPLWPQAWFMLAQDCYYLKLWPESVHFCEVGQGLPMGSSNLFQSPTDLESGWMIYQAVALWQCGRVEEAAEVTIRALQLRPDDTHHQANAVFFRNQMEAAIAQRKEA